MERSRFDKLPRLSAKAKTLKALERAATHVPVSYESDGNSFTLYIGDESGAIYGAGPARVALRLIGEAYRLGLDHGSRNKQVED